MLKKQSIKIKFANFKDLPWLTKVVNSDSELHFTPKSIDYNVDDFKKLIKHKNVWIKIIWCDKERAGFGVGYGLVFWGYLDLLFILSKFRNKHLGSKLLEDFILYCKKQKYKSIELAHHIENQSAEKFYKKHGFHKGDKLNWEYHSFRYNK